MLIIFRKTYLRKKTQIPHMHCITHLLSDYYNVIHPRCVSLTMVSRSLNLVSIVNYPLPPLPFADLMMRVSNLSNSLMSLKMVSLSFAVR